MAGISAKSDDLALRKKLSRTPRFAGINVILRQSLNSKNLKETPPIVNIKCFWRNNPSLGHSEMIRLLPALILGKIGRGRTKSHVAGHKAEFGDNNLMFF
jgi:hypothetical protein